MHLGMLRHVLRGGLSGLACRCSRDSHQLSNLRTNISEETSFEQNTETQKQQQRKRQAECTCQCPRATDMARGSNRTCVVPRKDTPRKLPGFIAALQCGARVGALMDSSRRGGFVIETVREHGNLDFMSTVETDTGREIFVSFFTGNADR